MYEVIALLSIVALAGGVLAYWQVRIRYRLLWQKLWALEKQIRDQSSGISHEFESALKQLAESRFNGKSRIPLAMPSQHGEDVLLWNFFGRKLCGYFVEVGAYDGFTFSNTYFFEAIGWTGTLVEPVSQFASLAEANRPFSKVINVAADGPGVRSVQMWTGSHDVEHSGAFSCAVTAGSENGKERIRSRGAVVSLTTVEACTMDQILADVNLPIDFLSIDVEGKELDVLKGFSLDRFAPSVLIIEDNTYGKDAGVADYLMSFGYEQRYRRGPNIFYCRSDDDRQFTWV